MQAKINIQAALTCKAVHGSEGSWFGGICNGAGKVSSQKASRGRGAEDQQRCHLGMGCWDSVQRCNHPDRNPAGISAPHHLCPWKPPGSVALLCGSYLELRGGFMAPHLSGFYSLVCHRGSRCQRGWVTLPSPCCVSQGMVRTA